MPTFFRILYNVPFFIYLCIGTITVMFFVQIMQESMTALLVIDYVTYPAKVSDDLFS